MLEDPSKILKSKTGQIMGYKGRVVGESQMASDPDKFAKILDDHMIAKGITSFDEKVKTLYQILPSTAANLMRILIQQRETLEQHARLYNQAPGLDEAGKNQQSDPTAGVKNLASALNDLGAAVTSPAMATVGTTMAAIAGGIRMLADATKDHPVAAMTAGTVAAGGGMAGAGYLTYQMLNGFGLKTAAGELITAAELLKGAAAKQGIAGEAGGLLGGGGKGLAGRLLSASPAVLALLGFDAATIALLNGYRAANPKEFRGGAHAQHAYATIDGENATGSEAPPTFAQRPGHWENKPGAARYGGGRHWVDDVVKGVDDAKALIETLNNVSASPQVSISGIEAAIAKTQQLVALLASVSGAASNAGAAASRLQIPSLGASQRGNFTTGGIAGGSG